MKRFQSNPQIFAVAISILLLIMLVTKIRNDAAHRAALAELTVTVCCAAPTADGAVPGLMFAWEGTNPDGLKVRATMLMTIFNKQRVVLMSLGESTKISAREEVLKDVFSNLMP